MTLDFGPKVVAVRFIPIRRPTLEICKNSLFLTDQSDLFKVKFSGRTTIDIDETTLHAVNSGATCLHVRTSNFSSIMARSLKTCKTLCASRM